MALKETRIVKYELTDVPSFEGVEFTKSSKDYLSWPAAVRFAADHGAVLQSAREAAAFRVQAEGKDDADRYQSTRTGAVYFKEGSKFYVAFDDAPDASRNIILARVQEGYDAHSSGREWILPKQDKHVAQILKCAEKSGRVLQVVESPLELATHASAGSSAFGNNDVVQALFGDVADSYAGMLRGRGYSRGFVHLRTLQGLDEQVDVQSVLIRSVGLGGDNFDGIDNVGADVRFYDGRARGVRNAKNFHRK